MARQGANCWDEDLKSGVGRCRSRPTSWRSETIRGRCRFRSKSTIPAPPSHHPVEPQDVRVAVPATYSAHFGSLFLIRRARGLSVTSQSDQHLIPWVPSAFRGTPCRNPRIWSITMDPLEKEVLVAQFTGRIQMKGHPGLLKFSSSSRLAIHNKDDNNPIHNTITAHPQRVQHQRQQETSDLSTCFRCCRKRLAFYATPRPLCSLPATLP